MMLITTNGALDSRNLAQHAALVVDNTCLDEMK